MNSASSPSSTGAAQAAPRIPRVLSIAGTDPTGGAGVQADLKSIAANGGYGMAVVTALVAQNTQGVRSIHVPPMSFLREQLDAVSDDVRIDALKIGMLGTVDIIATVADWLAQHRPPVLVLDPVMVATSGDRLLDAAAEDALRALLHQADLITPNMPELAVLADAAEASDWPQVLQQAQQVASRYQVHVLAKGGICKARWRPMRWWRPMAACRSSPVSALPRATRMARAARTPPRWPRCARKRPTGPRPWRAPRLG